MDHAVFINYRGEDSHSYGALLYTELIRQFGVELVFLDCESIPAGADFVQELLERVRSARVLLAVIGPRWLTAADTTGGRRIDDPADWIRRELAEAFTAGVRVIPVLIEQTEIPAATELPVDIAALSRCQYRRLRYREPTADLGRIVTDLTRLDPTLAAATRSRDGAQRQLAPALVDAVPRELPLDVLGFAGRQAQLAELDRLQALAGKRASAVVISAIDGMAGVGKTALAVHAAHRLVDRYPDGQLFVDLHGYTPEVAPVEPGAALEQMLRSLGVPGERVPATVQERSALLRTRLADRRVLVVLDNAATDAQVRPLLPGTPGCLVLVTSRTRLTGLDDAIPLSLDVLPAEDAVTLFSQALGEHRIIDADVVGEITELCGRLPLAIRIAAARLRHRPTWNTRHLAEQLRDEQSRLGQLHAGHLSVTTALGVSYDQLTTQQQRLFQLLSVHPGSDIDPYATAALSNTTVPAARQVLEQLLDVHLLIQRIPGRYVFHDLVRAYATERAHTNDPELDRRAALTRLRDHYAHTATVAMDTVYPHDVNQRPHPPAPKTPVADLDDPVTAEAWLDTELRNLLATARTAGPDSPGHIIHLSATLHRHLRMRGRYTDAETLHHHAHTFAQQAGDRACEINALTGLGEANTMQGRFEQAVDSCGQALKIAQDVGDRIGELNALNGLGRVLLPQGRFEQAANALGRALEIARDIRDRYGETYALNGLGFAHLMQGYYEQAVRCFRQVLDIARDTGDRYCAIYALNGFGFTHMHQGRYEQAVRCFEQVLDIARDAGDRYGEVNALYGLGFTHRGRGRFEQAARCFGQALDIARDIGDRYGEIYALYGLGNDHLVRGRHEQALHCFEQVLVIARDVGNRYGEIYAWVGLGHTRLLQGRHEQATHYYEQALEIAQDSSRNHLFQVHHGLGQVHGATGDHEQALAHHRIALDLATELGQPHDQARAHDGLAHTYHAMCQPEPARHHWQTALNILTTHDIDHTEDPQVTTTALRAHLTNPNKPDTKCPRSERRA